MIPIRDHHKTSTFPFVTYAILAINILVFVFMLGMSPGELEAFIMQFALIPREIVAGQDLYTLLTSMFLHGSIGHIIGNMLFLFIFGDNLEDTFGHVGYLIFYLLAGLAASALQIITDPGSVIPNLGASGAIAGLLGGYLILFPNHRVDILVPIGGFMRTATVPAYTMLVYWIIAQVFGGLGSLGVEGGGIAYFAHIGGFIGGIILTILLRPFTSESAAYDG